MQTPAQFEKSYPARFAKALEDVTMKRLMEEYRKRLEKDLNRIAQARLDEGSLKGTLTFLVVQEDAKTLVVKPSNPALFRLLEMGEFNPDGTLKTPPYSIMEELKVIVRA